MFVNTFFTTYSIHMSLFPNIISFNICSQTNTIHFYLVKFLYLFIK